MTAGPAPFPGYTAITDVEHAARLVISDVRDHDPHTNLEVLTMACQHEPTRMAQVLMCLAAWVGDDVLPRDLDYRATVTALGNPHVEIPDRRPACRPTT